MKSQTRLGERWYTERLSRRRPFQFRLRSLLLVITGVAIVCSLAASLRMLSSRRGVARNVAVSPVRNLPQDAEYIEYYLPGALDDRTYYSFYTSNASFLQWARDVHHVEPALGSAVINSGWTAGLFHPGYSIYVNVQRDFMYRSGGTCLIYDSNTGRAHYYQRSTKFARAD